MDIPVALFFYRRPRILERVFQSIRDARPRRLLLIADGPRPDADEEERHAVEKCRRLVEKIDWPCEVSTEYAAANLGCRNRLRSGLDWVFDTVEEAIILEDDCLPHPDFFPYCAHYLDRFRDDPRVLSLCGLNPLPVEEKRPPCTYSHYFHATGWATWSSAWRAHFDLKMKGWPEFRDSSSLKRIALSEGARRFWQATMESTDKGWNDSWAYAWQFAHWKAGALAVRPPANLVTHLGQGADSAHPRAEENSTDPWEALGIHPLPTNSLEAALPEPVPDLAVDELVLRYALGMIEREDMAWPEEIEERAAWSDLDRLHQALFQKEAELREKEDVIQNLIGQLS